MFSGFHIPELDTYGSCNKRYTSKTQLVRKTTSIALISLVAIYSSPSSAISEIELKSLERAVIGTCRGGTHSGSVTRIETSTRKNVVTVRNMFKDEKYVDILVSSEEWNGIQALTQSPKEYSRCVQHLMAILVPKLKIKRDIDKDLNARMEYIRSPVFCERLGYVISRAPSKFAEWRQGPGKSSSNSVEWPMVPYLMGNPEKLGMVQQGNAPLQEATVNKSGANQTYYFNEPLVFTHRFSANTETGLIIDQTKKAVDRCLYNTNFSRIDDVRYAGGPYKFKDGAPYWSFDETGFLGVTKGSFIVTIGSYGLPMFGEQTQIIYLNVHSPK